MEEQTSTEELVRPQIYQALPVILTSIVANSATLVACATRQHHSGDNLSISSQPGAGVMVDIAPSISSVFPSIVGIVEFSVITICLLLLLRFQCIYPTLSESSTIASAAISKISVERGEDVDRRGRARARTGAKRNAKCETTLSHSPSQ